MRFSVGLIGKGAREHALAWKMAQSPHCQRIDAWPGNPLMDDVIRRHRIVGSGSVRELVAQIRQEGVDLVVCGPEQPLADGLADDLQAAGVPCFGPTRDLARLESSKSFAKELMTEAGIPTAGYTLCQSLADARALGHSMVRERGAAVLKADGLVGGKGVFVCTSPEQVDQGIQRLDALGAGGQSCVVEHCIVGREVSFFFIVGKRGWHEIGSAVDFKRLKDNDDGPNTGGMGSYTPVPWLPQDASSRVATEIMKPLIQCLASRGQSYTGFLYCGLMWTATGPQVIEFNVRLGDPEAQVLAAADDRDWLELIASQLGLVDGRWTPYRPVGPTVGVVAAGASYPYSSDVDADRSQAIPRELLTSSDLAFGSSVEATDDGIRPGAGRILTLVSTADSFASARRACYDRLDRLKGYWPDCQYRSDIAARADAYLPGPEAF